MFKQPNKYISRSYHQKNNKLKSIKVSINLNLSKLIYQTRQQQIVLLTFYMDQKLHLNFGQLWINKLFYKIHYIDRETLGIFAYITRLKINLIDQNDKLFPNTNKIPISLALYTVQNPPKFLDSNTLGNKMLKGYTEQDLYQGICLFEKIQIKQVTSHYRKGMLFLIAFCKMPSFGNISDCFSVDYTKVRPLVIDKLVVRAKKTKDDVKQESGKFGNMRNNEQIS